MPESDTSIPLGTRVSSFACGSSVCPTPLEHEVFGKVERIERDGAVWVRWDTSVNLRLEMVGNLKIEELV